MIATLNLSKCSRMQFNFCLIILNISPNLVFSQQLFYLTQIEENEEVIGKVIESAMVRSKLSCYARYVLMVCKPYTWICLSCLIFPSN